MFWHLLLSQQREQLGRQLLCCPGRQLIAVFAKARDRRQCRGKSRRHHKRTDCRGADHCYTPRRGTFPIPVVGGFRRSIEVTSTSVTLGSKSGSPPLAR